MKNDDVEDDIEELLAARARMLRSHPSFMPDLDADTDDPVIEALQRAHERSNEPTDVLRAATSCVES